MTEIIYAKRRKQKNESRGKFNYAFPLCLSSLLGTFLFVDGVSIAVYALLKD